MAEERIIDQIAAILKKAERTDNQHERETFFAAAQAKATKYDLDLAMLRERGEKGESAPKPESRKIDVGSKGDRGAGAYSSLYWAIAKANGIRCIFYGNSSIEAFGFDNDLDMTDMLYAVVVQQMVSDCIDYLDSGEWRERTTRANARKSFYEGYIKRIGDRLNEARNEAESAASAEYAAQGRNTEIALRDKNRAVSNLYWESGGYSLRSYRGIRGQDRSSKSAGRSAASRARLGGEKAIGSRKRIS